MNVLGLDEVLNLVRQYGDDGEAAPEERRRGRGQGGRRPLGRGLREHHRRNQAQRAQRQAQRQESRICPCWFGGLGRWPSGLRIVRKAIMVMAGQLVRKLILPWQQYPWRLWPLALPDARAQPRLGETRAQTTWKRGTPPGLNMKQKQHRTTGFNLFQSDFRKTLAAQEVVGHGRENFVHGAAQAWRQLPAGQKAAYSVRAKGVNRLRMICWKPRVNRPTHLVVCGAWVACRISGPFATDVLQESLGEGNLLLNTTGLQWEKARSIISTSNNILILSFSNFNTHCKNRSPWSMVHIPGP